MCELSDGVGLRIVVEEGRGHRREALDIGVNCICYNRNVHCICRCVRTLSTLRLKGEAAVQESPL